MVGIPRVARGRPRKIETRTADCKFVRRKLTQDDGAGAAQSRDAYRVGRCDIVDQQLRMARCGQSRDIDNVFDADWHTMQWATLMTRCDLGLGCPGCLHRCIAIKPNEDIELRI